MYLKSKANIDISDTRLKIYNKLYKMHAVHI